MNDKQSFASQKIQAHRHQDIVEDIFDLCLLGFGFVWLITQKHFSQETLATVAMAGASARVLGRRVFKAVFGPRILKAVDQHRDGESDSQPGQSGPNS